MKRKMLKGVVILILLFVITVPAYALRLVTENSGRTWYLSSGDNLARVGLVDATLDTITSSDIRSLIRSGQSSITGFYNGFARDNGSYVGNVYDSFSSFNATSLDRLSDGRIFDVLFITWSGTSGLTWEGGGGAGAGTVDGPSLGTTPVAEPATLLLLGAGLAGLAGIGRRKIFNK